MTESIAFEIQICGSDLVVVFEKEREVVAPPGKAGGPPVLTGKKTCVFDENDLIERIELLKKLRTPADIEKRALGDLRRAVFAAGLPPKRTKGIESEAGPLSQDKHNWISDLLKTINQRN